MPLLTYLAHLKQLPFKNEWQRIALVSTMLPFLLTQRKGKLGGLHKETVIIGIVQDAVWGVQNKSTGVWLKVAGHWHKVLTFTLSLSPVEGRK
jgi:hypothetical protein